MRRDAAVAVGLFAFALVVLAWGVSGRSLYNGDEAIWAMLAREMRESGDWLHLRVDGGILHQRPPLFVWLLAAGTGVGGESELSLRVWSLVPMAGCAAMTYLIGRRLIGRPAAAVAGALLPTLALPYLYGRAVQSDATMTLLFLAAVYFYLESRERPRMLYAAGAAIGLALMTKQLIGALPLLALAPGVLARGRAGLPPRREFLRAAGIALAILAPWHIAMLAMHGGAFVDGYLGYNVMHRSAASVLAPTQPSYYLQILADKEGVAIAALMGAGALLVARRAWHQRSRRETDLLLLLWPLVVIGFFSMVSTRIDYYILPAYPFLALLVAAPLELLFAQPRLRAVGALFGAAFVIASFAQHIPQRARAADPFVEFRELSLTAGRMSPPETPYFVVNELFLTHRFYSRRPTWMITTEEGVHERYRALDVLHDTPRAVYLPPGQVGALLDQQPRWTAVLLRQQAGKLAQKPGVLVLGETPHYVLLGKLTD